MDIKILEEAAVFYGLEDHLDEIHTCYNALGEHMAAFDRTAKELIESDYSLYTYLWARNTPEKLFGEAMPHFSTNLLILAGYPEHLRSFKEFALDDFQIKTHKQRVHISFLLEYERNGQASPSQVYWAYHFIRGHIVEYGRFQFEYTVRDGNNRIYIHIPRGERMNKATIAEDLKNGVEAANQIYHLRSVTAHCNSWMLSPEVISLLPENSAMGAFSSCYKIEEGPDCFSALLDFLYNNPVDKSIAALPEDTSLRKKVKQALLEGKVFHTGMGTLNV